MPRAPLILMVVLQGAVMALTIRTPARVPATISCDSQERYDARRRSSSRSGARRRRQAVDQKAGKLGAAMRDAGSGVACRLHERVVADGKSLRRDTRALSSAAVRPTGNARRIAWRRSECATSRGE